MSDLYKYKCIDPDCEGHLTRAGARRESRRIRRARKLFKKIKKKEK